MSNALTMFSRSSALSLLVGAAACGCGSSVPAPNVAAYQQLVADTKTSVAQHRATAVNMTAADCAAERDRYAAQVQSQLDHMRQMSGGMDDCSMAMGHSGGMMSMCTSMDSEVTHHTSVACTGADTDIRAEATRHCDAMDGVLDTMATQTHDMAGMMGGSMMSGGSCHM